MSPHRSQPIRLPCPWDSPGENTGVSCHFLLQCMKVKTERESEVAQSCLTLCDPMDYSPPSSSVHGILQARILEWVAIPFSRESSQRRYPTQVSCISGSFFTNWATLLSLFALMHWRRKWQPTPVFSPGESQGRGSLVGCHLWGRTELDTTEAT